MKIFVIVLILTMALMWFGIPSHRIITDTDIVDVSLMAHDRGESYVIDRRCDLMETEIVNCIKPILSFVWNCTTIRCEYPDYLD